MGNLKEFLVVLSAVLLLAGCGSPQNSAESGSGPASTGTLDTASGSGTGGSPELPTEVLRSVSLTVSLNESGTAATRSLTRTAIGTFEEITTLPTSTPGVRGVNPLSIHHQELP